LCPLLRAMPCRVLNACFSFFILFSCCSCEQYRGVEHIFFLTFFFCWLQLQAISRC
jgi:hypothetical protein